MPEELEWFSEDRSLEDLMQRYPAYWEDAAKEISSAATSGRALEIMKCRDRALATSELWSKRLLKSRSNPHVVQSALPNLIKSRMTFLGLERCYLAVHAGKVSGKVRFNFLNGAIIQLLLFERHLTPKLVSMRTFRFWWRIVTQKRILMPLVKDKGIYCFYTRELLQVLAARIGSKKCLEIGAGNGVLSRFLQDAGVNAIATDNHSWSNSIAYPSSVEKLSAKDALTKYQPEVVVCSWPPPGNTFEKMVFRTKSVELYIVIGSRNKLISGNWDSYSEQQQFDWQIDETLSELVVPPELQNAVLVFQRKRS